MALFFPGRSKCALCGLVIEGAVESRGFPAFLRSSHELAFMSDANAHEECFMRWQHRNRFERMLSAFRVCQRTVSRGIDFKEWEERVERALAEADERFMRDRSDATRVTLSVGDRQLRVSLDAAPGWELSVDQGRSTVLRPILPVRHAREAVLGLALVDEQRWGLVPDPDAIMRPRLGQGFADISVVTIDRSEVRLYEWTDGVADIASWFIPLPGGGFLEAECSILPVDWENDPVRARELASDIVASIELAR